MKPDLQEFYEELGLGMPELSNTLLRDLALASAQELNEELTGKRTLKNIPHDLYSTKRLAGIIKNHVKAAFSEEYGIHVLFYTGGILEPLRRVIEDTYNLNHPPYDKKEKPIKPIKTIDGFGLEAHLLAMELGSVEILSKENILVLRDFMLKLCRYYGGAAYEDMQPRYALSA